MIPNQMIVISVRRDLKGVQAPPEKRKTEHLSCLVGQVGGCGEQMDHLSIEFQSFL